MSAGAKSDTQRVLLRKGAEGAAGEQRHVLRFITPGGAPLDKWTRPILAGRLPPPPTFREQLQQQQQLQRDAEASGSMVVVDDSQIMSSAARSLAYLASRALRMQDRDGTRKFQGNPDPGSSYALLVFKPGASEATVMPVTSWYNMKPSAAADEEAEEGEEAEKGSGFGRALKVSARKRAGMDEEGDGEAVGDEEDDGGLDDVAEMIENPFDESDEEEDAKAKAMVEEYAGGDAAGTTGEKGEEAVKKPVPKRLTARKAAGDEEEPDVEHDWADDEEGGPGPDGEAEEGSFVMNGGRKGGELGNVGVGVGGTQNGAASMVGGVQVTVQSARAKLSKTGQEMRSLLMKQGGAGGNLSDSEDQSPSPPAGESTPFTVAAAGHKRQSPPLTAAAVAAAAAKRPKLAAPVVLSLREEDIRKRLQAVGKTAVKSFVKLYADILKTAEDKKHFADVIKKLGSVVEEGGVKLLVIRPEFNK